MDMKESSNNVNADGNMENFDWTQFQVEREDPRSQMDKLRNLFLRNPFVPIGMTATVAALTFGIINFYKKNRRMSQLMMRSRVFAQGFTILSLVGGLYYESYSGQN